MRSYQTTTYGKWILSGEHAVLRGSAALAFPLRSRTLHLKFEPMPAKLDVIFNGEDGEDLRLLFFGVIEHALLQLGVREPLAGRFEITSSIPVGTGLGASAALCGAVSRWCCWQGFINKEEVYEFSRLLENLFHGESSGVDLAVALSGEGVRFVRGGERRAIECIWSPNIYLSYSGVRGMTSECVARVKRLHAEQPRIGENLDLQMARSVDMAERALKSNSQDRLVQLADALQMGRSCFERWGLCQGDLAEHMKNLDEMGALAVKPTGSGGGGYVLSLWPESFTPPKQEMGFIDVQI